MVWVICDRCFIGFSRHVCIIIGSLRVIFSHKVCTNFFEQYNFFFYWFFIHDSMYLLFLERFYNCFFFSLDFFILIRFFSNSLFLTLYLRISIVCFYIIYLRIGIRCFYLIIQSVGFIHLLYTFILMFMHGQINLFIFCVIFVELRMILYLVNTVRYHYKLMIFSNTCIIKLPLGMLSFTTLINIKIDFRHCLNFTSIMLNLSR